MFLPVKYRCICGVVCDQLIEPNVKNAWGPITLKFWCHHKGDPTIPIDILIEIKPIVATSVTMTQGEL